MLIGEVLRLTASRTPESEALESADERLSYAEMDARVNMVANALRLKGVKTGDRVIVMSRNCIAQVITYIAVMRLGAVVVPVNYRLREEELAVIFDDCSPSAVIFAAESADSVLAASRQQDTVRIRICLDANEGGHETLSEALLHGDTSHPVILDMSPNDVAMIMYTSGTTGKPKGVMLSHYGQWRNSIICALELGLRPHDRTLHVAPLFHVGAWQVYFMPHMHVGAANVIVPDFDPHQIANTLLKFRISNFLGVPSHFQLWQSSDGPTCVDVGWRGTVGMTGATPQPGTVKWIRNNVSKRLYNVYGCTEATSLITILQPEESWRYQSDDCIGRALVDTEIRIVGAGDGPDHGSVPDGEVGELIARSPKAMLGYWQNTTATELKIRDGWLYTGDLAFRDREGNVYLRGRTDDMIITGGENVYPVEVESALTEYPGVVEAKVFGVPDEIWGERITAVVSAAREIVPDELLEHCRSRLANYKCPRSVSVINRDLPRSVTGKVSVAEVRALVEG